MPHFLTKRNIMSKKCDGYGESVHNYFIVLLGEGGSSDLSRNFTKGVDKRTLSNIFAKFVTVDKDKAEVLYESGNRETQSRVKRRIARLFQSPSQKGPLIYVFWNLYRTYLIICLISDSRHRHTRTFI